MNYIVSATWSIMIFRLWIQIVDRWRKIEVANLPHCHSIALNSGASNLQKQSQFSPTVKFASPSSEDQEIIKFLYFYGP